MRKLTVSAIFVLFSCFAILAQQTDKSNSKPAASLPPSALAADNPSLVPSFQLSPPALAFGKSHTVTSEIRASAESTKPENPFVVLGGAVYMRLPGSDFLVPVSGGGASGCFSLDLPQRIKNLKEIVPKLKSLEQNF